MSQAPRTGKAKRNLSAPQHQLPTHTPLHSASRDDCRDRSAVSAATTIQLAVKSLAFPIRLVVAQRTVKFSGNRATRTFHQLLEEELRHQGSVVQERDL